MNPGDELVDITDLDGNIVGQVPRHEMRAKTLPHRATYVVQLLVDPVDAEPHSHGWVGNGHLDEQVERWFDSVVWSEGFSYYDGPGHDLSDLLSVGLDSRVVVHKRADWKDVAPGFWDLAFGGVCGAGEMWRSSARRELMEEASLVDVPLIPVGAGRWIDDSNVIMGGLFLTPTTQQPVPNDGEVVAVDEISIGELAAWCGSHQICGDTLAFVPPVLDRLIQATDSR